MRFLYSNRKRIYLLATACLLALILLGGTALADDCATAGHSFAVTGRVAATQEQDGSVTYRCGACGYEYTEILPATGHRWSAWTTDKEPTCAAPGSRRRTCSLHAAHDQTETMPALGHDYKLTQTPPTCEEAGQKIFACTRCDGSYTEPGVPALGHDYKLTRTLPACEADGASTYTCARCADAYAEPLPARGHDFADWAEETPADEGQPGMEARLCVYCGAREERILPALPMPLRENGINGYDVAFGTIQLSLLAVFIPLIWASLRLVRRDRKCRALIALLKERKMEENRA